MPTPLRQKKNKVLIITTEGCEACALACDLIEAGIAFSNRIVELDVQDVHNIDKAFLKQHHIEDFPTTFLMQDDKVRFKFSGTRPPVVISQWIRVHLK